jgi:GNAT superfamily N-acetyltransferase
MNEDYQIAFVDRPEDSAWGIIGRGISQYNRQQAGEHNFQRLCFVLRTPDGEILGGVLGDMHWTWLHLDLLWVTEELRGRGYGRLLLLAIEDEARRRGASDVFLDTFSFQAPDFYKKYGYRVFGELDNFPAGHQRYFLVKHL